MSYLSDIPIKNFMSKDVIFIHKNDSMNLACEKLRTHNIRHLPVLDKDDRVVGMFTDTDLNRAYTPRQTENGWYYDSSELDKLILEHFMTKEPSMLFPDSTLGEAAGVMARNKIGCVIVVSRKNKTLIGIISSIDILKQISG